MATNTDGQQAEGVRVGLGRTGRGQPGGRQTSHGHAGLARPQLVLLLLGLLGLSALGVVAGFRLQAAPADPAHRTNAAPPVAPTFRTLPPGATLPSDQDCARRVRRSAWEPRPENWTPNHTMPARVTIPDWGGVDEDANRLVKGRISGRFTGTTDEIVQWASCKWGFDDNLTRALAYNESLWVQGGRGDVQNDRSKCTPDDSAPCPTSFGLMQIKHYYHPGTYPMSVRSTSFNVDYALANLRVCYEGQVEIFGGDYGPGDLWGCVGVHFSGHWKDVEAGRYTSEIRGLYRTRPWRLWEG
jgi:hypothetical protein